MTPFQKYWITSTLAPESIISTEVELGHVHYIMNENKSLKIFVIEASDKLFLGENIEVLEDFVEFYNMENLVKEISNKLELDCLLT